MRLRHVKGSEEIIQNSNYVIHNNVNCKDSIQDIFFNNNEKLYVEVGTGKGDFIIESAKRYPHINFIGIEKYDSVLVRALQKLEMINLPNLKFLCMDAIDIEQFFSKEIDLIYLNFSDPWPKDRHEKRRLSSSFYLDKYENIFKHEKRIIMKTDNRKLFEYSIKSFTNYGYYIKDISLDLYQDEIGDNIPTEYETKFHSLGYPIYRIEVFKK